MGRAAIVRDGLVENVIVADAGFDPGKGYTLVPLDDQPVSIGDLFDGKGFTPAPAMLPPVPESVTPLQMRKALRSVGLKPAVDAFVAALGDEEAAEEWEYALAIERGNPMLNNAAAQLGMNAAQVDDLFRLAATMT